MEGQSSSSPRAEIQTDADDPFSKQGIDRTFATDALLFAGQGTWSPEIASLQNILESHGLSYRKVTSIELDSMSIDQIADYGTLVFPGGLGGTIASTLQSQTRANLRAAVQVHGVGYVGFCAGAFIAVAPAPKLGKDVSYGLGIVDDKELDYYYLEYQGVTAETTLHTFADGSTADILWYGGPVTPDRGVVARYPNGQPAISEMWSGNGFVVISGGHPTATQSMLHSLGVNSSDGTHTDVAWEMISAALHQQPLPIFQ